MLYMYNVSLCLPHFIPPCHSLLTDIVVKCHCPSFTLMDLCSVHQRVHTLEALTYHLITISSHLSWVHFKRYRSIQFQNILKIICPVCSGSSTFLPGSPAPTDCFPVETLPAWRCHRLSGQYKSAFWPARHDRRQLQCPNWTVQDIS